MGRHQGPPFTRHGMMRATAIALAMLLAGCGGNANVQATSGNVSAAGTVSIPGRSSFGTLLSIVFLAGVSYEGERGMSRTIQVPEPDPARRVAVQDCTKPIEDWSANLKCR